MIAAMRSECFTSSPAKDPLFRPCRSTSTRSDMGVRGGRVPRGAAKGFCGGTAIERR